MFSFTSFFLSLNLVCFAAAFTPQLKPLRSTSLHSSPSSLEELLSSDSWDPIKNNLNSVPAFACANDQGQPLQYNVGGNPLAFFFLDIDAAKDELQKAEDEMKMDGLSLVPFPLGEVFEMGAKQMALVIPSSAAIESAGAPKGTNPMGQQIPLFGCLDMIETLPDGTSNVPLFLSMDEAKEAMNMALESVPEEEKSKFDVTVIPLAGTVQMQATNPNKSFTYVPPMASLEYLKSLEK